MPTPSFARFVDQLSVGDLVSVVKYWGDIERFRFGGVSVLPFTEIDGGPGSEQVNNFLQEQPPFNQLGYSRYLSDGLITAVSQFETVSATLPEGPKAIVTVECCADSRNLSDVIAGANAGDAAIFDIGRPLWTRYLSVMPAMKGLAANTGGIQVKLSNVAPSEDALPTMASWLKDGYRVSIPHDAIDDCDRHKLAVTVRGESTSVAFSRCDTTPEFLQVQAQDRRPRRKACQVEYRHDRRHRYCGAHSGVRRRIFDRMRDGIYE